MSVEIDNHEVFKLDDDSFREAVTTALSAASERSADIIGLAMTVVYSNGEANNIALGSLEMLVELQAQQLGELSHSLSRMKGTAV